jgi:hypothetical protein
MPATRARARVRRPFKFALTDLQRRDLMRLMHRVLEDVEADRRSYRILAKNDPQHGLLVKDGQDITMLTSLDEAAACRFLRLARLR